LASLGFCAHSTLAFLGLGAPHTLAFVGFDLGFPWLFARCALGGIACRLWRYFRFTLQRARRD
jgi:hypothetical protein